MLVQKPLDQCLTFTRSTTKWRAGNNGLFVQDAINVPSLSFDIIKKSAIGLSIEGAATNILVPSMLNVSASYTMYTIEQGKPSLFGDTSAVKYTRIATGDGPLAPPILSSVIPASTRRYCMWAIVEQVVGAQASFVLRMYQTTGTPTTIAGTSLNPVTGGIADASSSVPTLRGVRKLADVGPNGGQVWLVWQSADLVAGQTYSFYPYPCSGSNLNDSVICHHLQGEPDSYTPTSPIKTTTAQVTRASDSAVITDLTRIAFNPNGGTAVAQFIVPELGANRGIFNFSDGGTVSRITPYVNGVGTVTALINKASENRSIAGGTVAAGTVCRVAFAWAKDDMAISVNGGAAVSSAAVGTLPTVDRLRLGGSVYAGTDMLNGSLQYFNYLPVRKPNAELQALSVVQ